MPVPGGPAPRSPHLALLSTSFPSTHDGSEAAGSFVFDLCTELARRVRLTVIAPGEQAGTDAQEEGGFAVRRFRAPRLPLSLLRPLQPLHWSAIAATLRNGDACLGALAAGARPDHVLCLWALPCGWWARRTARRHGIPYSVWALGSDIWTLGRIPGLRALLRGVLRGSRQRFADGIGLGAEVEAIAGLPARFLPSTRVLACPSRPPPRTAPPYRLAFLGRWHPNKGVDLLLESLRLLGPREWSRIERVRIAGGGPLAAGVEAGVGGLRGEGRPVALEGFKDRAAAAELLGWADYLLIPSRIESIPVVFSDAMQCGCPVVCMPAGDLPELVARYGVGVAAADVSAAAFAESLREALDSSPARLGRGLGEARAAFALPRVGEELVEALFGCGGDPGARRG